jgi:hypothetical protein
MRGCLELDKACANFQLQHLTQISSNDSSRFDKTKSSIYEIHYVALSGCCKIQVTPAWRKRDRHER